MCQQQWLGMVVGVFRTWHAPQKLASWGRSKEGLWVHRHPKSRGHSGMGPISSPILGAGCPSRSTFPEGAMGPGLWAQWNGRGL